MSQTRPAKRALVRVNNKSLVGGPGPQLIDFAREHTPFGRLPARLLLVIGHVRRARTRALDVFSLFDPITQSEI